MSNYVKQHWLQDNQCKTFTPKAGVGYQARDFTGNILKPSVNDTTSTCKELHWKAGLFIYSAVI